MSFVDWICKKISLETASEQLSAITISSQQVLPSKLDACANVTTCCWTGGERFVYRLSPLSLSYRKFGYDVSVHPHASPSEQTFRDGEGHISNAPSPIVFSLISVSFR